MAFVSFMANRGWQKCSNDHIAFSHLWCVHIYICICTGCFTKFDIIWNVNMTETLRSRLMKLNRFNVEQYKNYSSKFE